MSYEYDSGGRLARTIDSEGQQESYTYDDKAQMISVVVGSEAPILVNAYDISGNVSSQTMQDGGKFRYHYTHDPQGRGSAVVPDVITAPNGLLTYFQYDAEGYTRSLPTFTRNQ